MWKKWFDTGWGLLGQVKYAVGLFGIAEISIFHSYKFILIIGFLYAVVCFLLGWAWLKYGFFETEIEINNIFNPFVKEVRNGKIFKHR